MDLYQLNQVLSNLVQNGFCYSVQVYGCGQVWLSFVCDLESDLLVLEVIDDGFGVLVDKLNNLFEFFFIIESKGIGLGFYFFCEFCESNQVWIDYCNCEEGGGCFCIIFVYLCKFS